MVKNPWWFILLSGRTNICLFQCCQYRTSICTHLGSVGKDNKEAASLSTAFVVQGIGAFSSWVYWNNFGKFKRKLLVPDMHGRRNAVRFLTVGEVGKLKTSWHYFKRHNIKVPFGSLSPLLKSLGIQSPKLRMVMEPIYLSEEVIIDPNHHLTRWLDP